MYIVPYPNPFPVISRTMIGHEGSLFRSQARYIIGNSMNFILKKRGRAAECTTSFFPFIVLALSLRVNTGTFDVAKVLLFYEITK